MNARQHLSRRDFLKGVATLTVLGLSGSACTTASPKTERGIELQPFGRTEHLSTRTLFGAYALAYVSQEEADRTLGVLLDFGINHIDTAPSYGSSELRIGPWMEEHRRDFFLATKVDQRIYEGAKSQFERSLERLQVDQVDLLQLHNLVEQWEWDIAMGENGALKALVEARDAGLVRFLGVTGHGLAAPAMHLQSLERFDFDSVLLPLNYPLTQNPQYAADFKALAELCDKRDVAVQTIKAIARGEWGRTLKTTNTWYEPLTEQTSIDPAVHWVLRWPNVFLNTAGDVDLLPKILDAATRAQTAPSEEQMKELVDELEMTPLWA